MASSSAPAPPSGSLHVERSKNGPTLYWVGHFRWQGKHVKRRLGLAHVEPRPRPMGEDVPAELRGWQRHYRKKRGRADAGALTADDAVVALRAAIKAHVEAASRPTPEVPALTFGQVADEWLEERRADVADGHLKPSTARDYASMLRRPTDPLQRRGRGRTAHVMRAFEDVRVADITGADVEAFERKLRAAKLAQQTRHKYAVVVSMILDYAVSRGYVESNPAAGVQPRKKRARKRKKLPDVYSLDTVELIAQEAEGSKRESVRQVADMIRLAGLTGLRQGELIALRWGDVDFTGRKITVSRSYGADVGEDVPKSGVARTVPLSTGAALILERVSRRDEWTRRSDLVFPNRDGGYRHDSTVRRAYDVARDAVVRRAASEGETLPVVTFHGLRHTFGTRLAMQGVPIPKIQGYMGHADIQTTMVYVHWMPQHDDADVLDRAFASTMAEVERAEALAGV